jgi:hypothetical protein
MKPVLIMLCLKGTSSSFEGVAERAGTWKRGRNRLEREQKEGRWGAAM